MSCRRASATLVGMLRLVALAAVVLLLPMAAAPAADPGRWRLTGRSAIPLEYFQGIASDPDRHVFFDGVFAGLYRTDDRLRERARRETAIPPEVTAARGYNHIGDPTWDARERGRILLPLECYMPGAPGGSNTCRRGAIGVADPLTLQWRYLVELDPAEIPKAMWAEVSPDGRLVWTSSGGDLLAYRSAAISRAASGAPPLRAVARISGVVPPSGISGAAFYGDRLLVAWRAATGFEVTSIDLATGNRRLEIQRPAELEPEGLDVADTLGGVLHWIVRPASGAGNVLLHYEPTAPRGRLRLSARPARLTAGRRTRVRFRATHAGRPVPGAVVRAAGRWARTGAGGTARMTVRLPRSGHLRVIATRSDLRAAVVTVRAAVR
jgi:hypothetical protein